MTDREYEMERDFIRVATREYDKMCETGDFMEYYYNMSHYILETAEDKKQLARWYHFMQILLRSFKRRLILL